MVKIKFSTLVTTNEELLKSDMAWENYELNDVTLVVTDLLKTHAITTLSREYGRYDVEVDILDELRNDVFMNFPSLMQQLSISRVINGRAVVPIDILTEVITRSDSTTRSTTGVGSVTLGSKVEETNTNASTSTSNSETNDTGSSTDIQDSTATSTSQNDIENSATTEVNGGKVVNLNYSLPNQAIIGNTESFPVDEEGTPMLSDATVDSANASYSTSNPLLNIESSNATQSQNQTSEVSNTTTNNLKNTQVASGQQDETGSRTINNSGMDQSNTSEEETITNTVTENIDRESTNAQYSYEINAFLESSVAHNAFKNWVRTFYWVKGII